MNVAIVDKNKAFIDVLELIIYLVDNLNVMLVSKDWQELVQHKDFQNLDYIFIDVNGSEENNLLKIKSLNPKLIIICMSENSVKVNNYSANIFECISKDDISAESIQTILKKTQKLSKSNPFIKIINATKSIW